MNPFLHVKVFAYVNLETAFHFLVIDLVRLPHEFLLLNLHHVVQLGGHVQRELFVDILLNLVHLFLHEGL